MERLGSNFEIAELIVKFLEKKLTAEEAEVLKNWVEESEDHQQLGIG